MNCMSLTGFNGTVFRFKTRGSMGWACVAHLSFALRNLNTEPSIDFLEIDQSETRIACGGHVS